MAKIGCERLRQVLEGGPEIRHLPEESQDLLEGKNTSPTQATDTQDPLLLRGVVWHQSRIHAGHSDMGALFMKDGHWEVRRGGVRGPCQDQHHPLKRRSRAPILLPGARHPLFILIALSLHLPVPGVAHRQMSLCPTSTSQVPKIPQCLIRDGNIQRAPKDRHRTKDGMMNELLHLGDVNWIQAAALYLDLVWINKLEI